MNLLLVYLLWFAGCVGTFWLSVALIAWPWRRVNGVDLDLTDMPRKLRLSFVLCAFQSLAALCLVSIPAMVGPMILDLVLFALIVNLCLAMIARSMTQRDEDEWDELEWIGTAQTGIWAIVLVLVLFVL